MVLYEQTKPYLLRVPTINDTSDKIQRFDSDNLYPQKAEMLIKRSYSLRAIIDRISHFVNGEGFVNPAVASLILNKKGLKGQTANKVLTHVAKCYTSYDTICLHINYNLNFTISSISTIPFSFIRFGLKNSVGLVDQLAYCTNWERDGRRDGNQAGITFYPTFNPDPAVVAEQIECAGGIMNYKGQILYLTPEDGQYSLATFDSVFDDAQTQVELGMFKVSNIQNSFLSTLAIMYPGEFGSKQEEMDFNDLIRNKTGSRNAGTRIGMQDKSGLKKVSDMFVNLTPSNLDKLFELTESTVKENIIENYGWPKILQGITPSGLFAQADIEEAYTYANSITRTRRTAVSEVFATILAYWQDPIIDSCDISECEYVVDSAPAGSDGTVNDAIKNMTGAQAINFARILRKYSEGKYKRVLAHSLLQQGFGLSDEEINMILDSEDEAAEEETGKPPAVIKDPAEVALQRRKRQTRHIAMAKQYL